MSSEEQARVAVAGQLRRLAHEFMRGDHDPADLESMARRLGVEADELGQAPPRSPRSIDWVARSRGVPPADGEEFENFVDRPISGLGHPWSVPLRVIRRGDRAVATVTLGPAAEGAPGRSHGGIVAAIYDDLLGFLLMLEQRLAFTASIRVDYKAGTPIGEPLVFQAWVDQTEGKKVYLVGECRDGAGNAVTTCEALFIQTDPSLMAGLNT